MVKVETALCFSYSITDSSDFLNADVFSSCWPTLYVSIKKTGPGNKNCIYTKSYHTLDATEHLFPKNVFQQQIFLKKKQRGKSGSAKTLIYMQINRK